VQTEVNDIVAAYPDIETTKKFICIRIEFAWMYPKKEDLTHRTFRVGIKYLLVAHHGKLTGGVKHPRSSVDFIDITSGGTQPQPKIIVPRKRPTSRGEELVQNSATILPPLVNPTRKRDASPPSTWMPMNLFSRPVS
jgi:hypothetical protein